MSRGHFLPGRSSLPPVQVLVATCALLLAGARLPAVDAPPVIIQGPSTQTAYVGMNVLLSARAMSDWPATYQWLADNKPLPGRTDSTLSLFCVSMVQSGQVYSVIVSNVYGAVTSAPATLHVTAPDFGPTPHVWGLNETVVHERFSAEQYRTQIGRQINVELQDTSIGGLWGTGIYTDDSSLSSAAYHSGVLPVGSKGTIAILISGPQASFVGSSQNGIISANYSISWPGSFQVIGRVPTITRHPISQVRMVGGSAVFTAEATGEGSLAYQWKHNGMPIEGETNPTLVVHVKSEADAGTYAVTVTDDVGSNSTDPAVLGVLPRNVVWPKSPIANPLDIPIGEFRHMTITGQTNYGIAWGNGFYTTDSDLQRVAVHDGWAQHGEPKVLTVVRLSDQDLFLAADRNNVLTRRYGRFPAIAIAGVAPTITKDPLSQGVYAGQSCRLFTEASHAQPVAFQWRKDGVAIPGATRNELIVPSGPAGTVTIYDVVADTPGNPIPSQGAYVYTLPSDATVLRVANASEALANLARPNTIIYANLKGAITPTYIYGTGIYTSDSDPDTASVHADRLMTGQVAEVGMYTLGVWPGFYGSTRNGLMSGSYIGMPGYVFIYPPPPPSPPTLSAAVAGKLLINGTPGYRCQIWGAASLTQPQWSLLDTVTLSTSSQLWEDPQPPSQGMRFYRVALMP